MIRKINRRFFICLCGVIGLAVGTIIGPRYFSRMLDQTNLNTVSVVNRDSFSFLEQSSDQLVDQVKLLNSIGNTGNLMLLSNYSDQETWQNQYIDCPDHRSGSAGSRRWLYSMAGTRNL